jgi:hypothetical protein
MDGSKKKKQAKGEWKKAVLHDFHYRAAALLSAGMYEKQ